MKFKIMYFFGILIAIAASTGAYFYFGLESRNLFYFILVVSVVVSLLPFMFSFLSSQKIQKRKRREIFRIYKGSC